jgi:ribosomal protein S27E
MTEDRASVYFNIDQGVLTVRKVKESKGGFNPNGARYGFSIVNGGSEFANIRAVKLCPKCAGRKQCWVKGEGTIACPECGELGYVDK